MRAIKTILVPVDFSDCSHALAARAAELAAKLGSQLVLVHIIDPPAGLPIATALHPDEAGAPVTVEAYLRAGAEARLPRYVDAASSREGVAAQGRVEQGRPAEAILRLANTLPAQMIVMGSHGRSGFNRLVLGSVSETVLRQAECPVLVIRSIHHAECEASNCAVCRSGVTRQADQVRAEQDG